MHFTEEVAGLIVSAVQEAIGRTGGLLKQPESEKLFAMLRGEEKSIETRIFVGGRSPISEISYNRFWYSRADYGLFSLRLGNGSCLDESKSMKELFLQYSEEMLNRMVKLIVLSPCSFEFGL